MMASHPFISALKTIINFLCPESNPPALEITNLEDMTAADDGASFSIAPGSTYEVFLSFRGADIRLSFTDHLYSSLRGARIRTFRDNEELQVGEEIGPDLIKAIEESSISIPIFSKGYASSKWCLREVTQMVKCMNDKDPEGRQRHTVCPIFYDVTPEDVKRQTGSFAEAFLKHTKDKKVDPCTIQEWKDALKEVGKLKGWEKDKIANGHEAKLIKKIVRKVCKMLKKNNVSQPDALFGMDHHREEMTKLLDNAGNGVLIVGIVGMGGIGKTTIAKFMYNKLCDQFRNQCSFLEDVRERVKRNGYDEVRKKLVSDVLKRPVDEIKIDKDIFKDKKVLIVLDDVENRSQLKEIIGNRDSEFQAHEYFGWGSRIIVTTRNKKVFQERDGDFIYAPKEMKFQDSLLLFYKHAFRSTQPRKGYEEISREVVKNAAGLPLSLVVIGSMLFSERKKEYWEATLKKLKTIPAADVQERLKISYDALDGGQKQIFLDIACHFIGEDKTLPCYMWEDCEFNPGCEIDNLVYLSLITIGEGNVFRMHDQLRDLGRYIVNQKNPDASEERGSRLWSRKEAVDTLKRRSGKEKVLTLHVEYDRGSYCHSNRDFKRMPNLRYLHLHGSANLEGDFKGLLPELRWFRWKRWFPGPPKEFSSIAVTNFCPPKLLILDLSLSNIRDGWESLIQIKTLTNLKVLNLSYCHGLTKTPDFSTLSKLERLNLEGCKNLTEIGSSINQLERLTHFNANSCYRLRKLPLKLSGLLRKLQCLSLKDCTSLVKIPETIRILKSLVELNISKTGITAISESVGMLKKLKVLDCSNCTSLVKIPESIKNLKSLVELNISKTGITTISESIGMLEKLKVLDCSNCTSLRGEVPSGIGRLASLIVLDLSATMVDTLPEDVGNLRNLRKLNLSGTAIKKLPGVGLERLQKLEELNCSYCCLLVGQLLEGIGRLTSLKVLDLSTTMVDTLSEDVGSLRSLRKLNLSGTAIKKIPMRGIERLEKLEELNCSMCTSLEGQLPEEIRRLSTLRVLNMRRTRITIYLPKDISGLPNLETLYLGHYKNLRLPTEELKLPLSLTKLSIPLTKASFNSVRGLLNLSDLEFYKNVGYCREQVEEVIDHDNNNNGTPLLPNMPSNLERLTLFGLDGHVMSCRLLPAMKFDSFSRLNRLKKIVA